MDRETPEEDETSTPPEENETNTPPGEWKAVPSLVNTHHLSPLVAEGGEEVTVSVS